jgi:hypothetical protein
VHKLTDSDIILKEVSISRILILKKTMDDQFLSINPAYLLRSGGSTPPDETSSLLESLQGVVV